MDPWLHSLTKSLTLRVLASPFINLDCALDDPLRTVLEQAEDLLLSSSFGRAGPSLSRAAIRITRGTHTPYVLVLDTCLRDVEWADIYSDDEAPVSCYARPVTIDFLTDGSTGFLDGLYHIQQQMAFGPRVADRNPDSPPPVEEGQAEGFFPRQFLVVLDGGRWHGVVTPNHFTEAVPVRVAILAMLLEIEEAIVAQCFRLPEHGTGFLSPGRILKARETAKRKGMTIDDPHDNPRLYGKRLIPHTMFMDKLEIAVKAGWLPRNWSEGRARQLESLRNWCCHTGDEAAYSLDELAERVKDATQFLSHLQSVNGASES